MLQIGLLSDTHSYLDDRILAHLSGCDEIWHAGDFGDAKVVRTLEQVAPVRGVYGNIDGADIRVQFPKVQNFECESLRVVMTHIGGYPGKYHPDIRMLMHQLKPGLFISGHSHILKIMPDKNLPPLLHINPGAAGKHGFHKVRTLVLFKVDGSKLLDLKVVELGNRA